MPFNTPICALQGEKIIKNDLAKSKFAQQHPAT